MQIVECEMVRLQIPFRRAFQHAAAKRSCGDAIIVRVVSRDGAEGFGEIQARPYVSGEDNNEIWEDKAPRLARRLIGTEIFESEHVREVLSPLGSYTSQPALLGGFDIAIFDALEIEHDLDWPTKFGPARRSQTTKCLTIGGDYRGAELKKQSRLARLGGYGVVKLKVGSHADAERVLQLREWLGPDIAIRLDANGELTPSSAIKLLQATARADIESIEEPLTKLAPDLVERLAEIHASTGITMVADESVCTVQDLERFVGRNSYQSINIRVGKSGGVTGTAELLQAARKSGFTLVSGTMVGETSVMVRVSERLLAHCEELSYVEGIDQAKKLLEAQAIVTSEQRPNCHFAWVEECSEQFIVGQKFAK